MKRGASHSSIIERAELFISKAKNDPKGRTAIHFAACEGDIETLDCLINSYKLQLSKKDKHDFTAMHYAASNGHSETIDYLFKNKLKATDKSDTGSTVVHCAAEGGHCDTIDHLVKQYQLDPAKKDKHWGGTAIHWASYSGQILCINHLITKYHLNPTEKDKNGDTALHWAALGDQIHCIKYLIAQHHLNPTEQNQKGQTILDIAHIHMYFEASFNLLLKFPALRMNELGLKLWQRPFRLGLALAEVLADYHRKTKLTFPADLLQNIFGFTRTYQALPEIHQDLHKKCLVRMYNLSLNIKLPSVTRKDENDKKPSNFHSGLKC